jgi:hypothetical protein
VTGPLRTGDGSGDRPAQRHSTPRWVWVSAVAVAVVVAIALITHLAGGGFGAHLHGAGR